MLKKKRSSEDSTGRQRQLYHMELDPDDTDDQDEHQDDDWDDEHEPKRMRI